MQDNTEYIVQIRSSCNENYISFKFTTACIVCPCIPHDVNITMTQTLNQSMISGNLIVASGVVLTINQDMIFNNNSYLIVQSGSKLIVDGAKLTSCNPLAKWNGIKVAGNLLGLTTSASVEMINGATIENARIGIDAVDNLNLFGNNITYGGGKIKLTLSSIKNSDIGISMGPYGWGAITGLGSSDDESEILRSSFIKCGIGIKLNRNIGSLIYGNTFDQNSLDIESGTSTFQAQSNIFAGGITAEALYPNFQGAEISNNNQFLTQVL
ncbi:MAG: hypothetical protein IPO92_13605 [Saprospiraceae bacterium]|nr:hypothetical protein [Saprospiraceae bacterium]